MTFPRSNTTIRQNLDFPEFRFVGYNWFLNVVAYFKLSPLNSDLFDEVMTKMSLKLYPDERKTHTPQISAKQVFKASGRQDGERRTSEATLRRQTRRKQLSDDEKLARNSSELARRQNTSALFELQARSEA